MSEDVSGQLASAHGELDNARSRAGATRTAIEEQQRKLGVRFPGVARNLGTVLPRLDIVDGRLATAATILAEAGTAADTVPDEPTPDQAKQHLTPVVEKSQEALETLNATVTDIGRAATHVGQVLSGGSPETLIGHVDSIKTSVQAAYTKARQAKDAAEQRLHNASNLGK